MARKKKGINKVTSFILFLAFTLATISVFSAMISGTLTLPLIAPVVMKTAGWIGVIASLLGGVMGLAELLSR